MADEDFLPTGDDDDEPDIRPCPKCGADVDVTGWGSMVADACPGCDMPVYINGNGDLAVTTYDKVKF